MSNMSVALGSAVNYTLTSNQAACQYKVIVINLASMTQVAFRDVVTNTNGVAIASFSGLPIGKYKLQAFGQNCGRCELPSKTFDIVAICASTCGDPATGVETCEVLWNIEPKNFVAGVVTPTTYTLSGLPNCKIKILFFEEDTPLYNEAGTEQLFTYITNGQPEIYPLNWAPQTVNTKYNWRPAPKEEQDSCLRNCIIRPARVNLSIAAGVSVPCAVSWSISPQDPVIGLAVAGHFYATGLPPSCNLKLQSFLEDNVTPLLVGGLPVYVDVPAAGLPFSTTGSVLGDTGWWKPAPNNLQSACLKNCTITPAAVHLAVKSAPTVSGCGTLVTAFSACIGGNATSLTFSGLTLGRNYTFQYASAVQFAAGVWVDAGFGSAVYADATTKTINLPTASTSPNTYLWARLMDNAQPTCVSNVAGPNPCSVATPSANWWCVSGTCVQSVNQPASSVGPYTSNALCTAAPCTAPVVPVAIRYNNGFSPAPAPCASSSGGTVEFGSYASYNFIVTGVLPAAVTVTGIPAGMSRVNGSSSITISGTPSSLGSFTLNLSSGACTQTLTVAVVSGCTFVFSMSPTTFVANVATPVTYNVSGPAGCSIKMGIYKNGSPILNAGAPLIFTLPTGATYSTNTWDSSYIGAVLEWRPVGPQPVCSAGSNCSYLPGSTILTVTA